MYIYAKIDGGKQERVKVLRKRNEPKTGDTLEIEVREPIDGRERLCVKVTNIEKLPSSDRMRLFHVQRPGTL